MPAKPFFEIPPVDLKHLVADRRAIYQVNPHRHEFQLLDGVTMLDRQAGRIAGYRDVKGDEFWVRGHIPGRPLFPGVLMIEASAQLVSYYVMAENPDKGFLGFGGVDGVKFRGTVTPGQQLILLGKMVEVRPRRCIGATQGFVDGQLVYEGVITGMWV